MFMCMFIYIITYICLCIIIFGQCVLKFLSFFQFLSQSFRLKRLSLSECVAYLFLNVWKIGDRVKQSLTVSPLCARNQSPLAMGTFLVYEDLYRLQPTFSGTLS